MEFFKNLSMRYYFHYWIFLFLHIGFTSSSKEKMKYKIIETENNKEKKVYKGNTMLYKKINYMTQISFEYEMVVMDIMEANIEFGTF